jgi:hypothetical protein
MLPAFIYKPGKEQIITVFLSRHHQLEETAELDKVMFYEPLINDGKNREAVFDSFLNHPVDAGAFPLYSSEALNSFCAGMVL